MKNFLKKMLLIAFLLGLSGTSIPANFPSYVTPSKLQEQPDKVIFDKAMTSILPPEVTFMIVDLKYTDDGRVVIIEFGDGCGAGFKVLDHTIVPGIPWTNFWNFLKKDPNLKHLQTWFVGNPNPKLIVGWDTFKKLGGLEAPNLGALEKDRSFQYAVSSEKVETPKTLKDYKGIIILKRYQPQKYVLEEFKKKYPQFLILNEATTKPAGNKKLTNELFDTPELKEYRPRSLVFPKQYSPTLAQTIIDTLKCKRIFIKPINSGRGNGIVGVPQRKLDRALDLILNKFNNYLPYDNNYVFHPNIPLTYQYWKYDRNSHFIVEEFVESKHITYRREPYDATIRTAFTLHHDGEGNIYLNFLGCYWKRPVKPVTAKASFRDKHISKHAPNFYESLGGEVEQKDMDDMYKQLRKVLPDIYGNMLNNYYSQKPNSI
ncbi:MAG: hypothetical protein V1855_04175 [bacterium]